jgi:hypothetical protein
LRASHRDFTKSQPFDLIRACAPVDLGHKAMPEARDKLRLGERTLLNHSAYSSDNLFLLSTENRKREEKEEKKT